MMGVVITVRKRRTKLINWFTVFIFDHLSKHVSFLDLQLGAVKPSLFMFSLQLKKDRVFFFPI